MYIFFSHLTLQVKDADVGVNGMVEYHINDDIAKSVFKIDSTTGAIELLRHLDYEKNTAYTFDVTVRCKKIFSFSNRIKSYNFRLVIWESQNYIPPQLPT